jgi:hypothetical protein
MRPYLQNNQSKKSWKNDLSGGVPVWPEQSLKTAKNQSINMNSINP